MWYWAFSASMTQILERLPAFDNLFCGQSHPGRTDRVYLKVLTALAAAVITFGCDMSALADLNKFEADLLVNSVLDWLLSSVLLLSG
ncbi:hypothetical protein Hanom_Chr11g01000391 [Helianthus anomalus]